MRPKAEPHQAPFPGLWVGAWEAYCLGRRQREPREGLRAGRSFVTNGPLLRVKANGQWPGHIFRGRAGEAIDVKFDVSLDSRDPINRIEIIRNGAIEKTIPRSVSA